jgi:DNA-binding NarL/FixJ family response regulator
MGKINVSIVDDHPLFRQGMAELINHFEGYQVLSQFGGGKEFLESIQLGHIPEIAILDIQMPGMNGEEIALWLKQYQPDIKVLSLSMHDDEVNILRMIKAGSRGYLLKSAEPDELKLALDNVVQHNYYHTELVTNTLMKSASPVNESQSVLQMDFLNKDLEFLRLVCTELTYKQIADQLNVSMRTIDSYRESLFERCQAKSRVGLAIFAIKNNLVKI